MLGLYIETHIIYTPNIEDIFKVGKYNKKSQYMYYNIIILV